MNDMNSVVIICHTHGVYPSFELRHFPPRDVDDFAEEPRDATLDLF